METLLVVLITLVSVALVILIIFTVMFLIGLNQAMKQIKLASQKIQQSADTATELVDEVRSAVVNPGVIALLFERYLKKKMKKGDKK